MHFLKTLKVLGVGALLLAGMATAQAGLVHRYTFNTNANDVVGTAHGTLVNGAFITNSALSLNVAAATTQYVNLPNGLFSSMTNMTIEVWTTPVARASWGRVFDFGSSVGGEDAAGGGV